MYKRQLKYRAEAEYRAADYQAASDTYGILIQVDKERPEYLNMRCVSKAQTGDLSGALDLSLIHIWDWRERAAGHHCRIYH